MANSPPVTNYSAHRRRRPSYLLLWWLVVGDLALGLAWLVAAGREFFSEGLEGNPSIAVEALRYSFLGLGLLTAMAWLVVTWFRPMRGAG